MNAKIETSFDSESPSVTTVSSFEKEHPSLLKGEMFCDKFGIDVDVSDSVNDYEYEVISSFANSFDVSFEFAQSLYTSFPDFFDTPQVSSLPSSENSTPVTLITPSCGNNARLWCDRKPDGVARKRPSVQDDSDFAELLQFTQDLPLPLWDPRGYRILRSLRKYEFRNRVLPKLQIFNNFGENFGINTAKTLQETINGLPVLFSNMIDELFNKLGICVEDAKSKAADLISTLYIVWRSRDKWDVCAAAIASFALRNGVSISSDFLDNFKIPVLQSAQEVFEGLTQFLLSFGGIIGFCFCVVLHKGIPTNFDSLREIFSINVLDISAKMGHALRAIEGLKSFVSQYSAKFAQFLTLLITGEKIDLPSEKTSALFKELVLKARRFESIDINHDMILDRSLISEMEDVITQCEDALLSLKNEAKDSDIDVVTFRALLANLKRQHTNMINICDARSKSRVEPLAIYIAGAPGVGKSYITDQLICYLAKQHNELVDKFQIPGTTKYDVDPSNMNSMKFAYNRANDFMDGYKCQFAAVMDDFGQLVDSSTRPNPEFLDIINWVNCAEHTVHSASLAEKGKIKFNSQVVIASSNKLNHTVHSITCPAALYRRFKLVAEFVVKSEFATSDGQLDTLKIDGSGDYYDISLYDSVLIPQDTSANARISTGLSLSDFFSKCSDLYFDKFSRAHNRGRNMEKALEKLPPFRLQMASSDESDNESDEEDRCSVVSNTPSDAFSELISEEDAELPTVYQLVKWTLTAEDGSVVDRAMLTLRLLYGQGVSCLTSTFSHFVELWNSCQPKIIEFFKKHSSILGLISTVAVFMIPYLWKRFRTDRVCENCSKFLSSSQGDQSFVKYLAAVSKTTRNCPTCKQTLENLKEFKTKTNNLRLETACTTEMCTDENSFAISNKIAKQMLAFFSMKGMHKFNGCLVKGRVALVNRHCAAWLEKETQFQIQRCDFTDMQLVYTKACTFHYPEDVEEDYCLISLPANVVEGKDLTGLFASKVELSKFDAVDATLVTLSERGNTFAPSYRSGQITSSDRVRECLNDESKTITKIRSGYEYSNIDTVSGDCGALLVVRHRLVSRKIVGMHAYGCSSSNGAVSVTSEKLERLLKTIPVKAQISIPDLPLVEESGKVISHKDEPIRNLLPLGEARPVFAPTKTEISPSPLHGLLESYPPTMAPSCLVNPQDPPLTKGLQKVANVPLPVEPELLRKCADHYFDNFPVDKENLNRVLSDDEMIKGIPLSDFQPICRTSSPGYPYILQEPGKGKKPWLGENENYIYRDDLRASVEDRIREARLGKRTQTIWVDTLKDERRPIEKVQAGKTRVFSYAPLDYILAVRKYFGGFAAFMSKNRINVESCVGVDPYTEWWRIARRLQEVGGDNIVAGDFSNFDGSLLRDVLEIICDKIQEWYGDENTTIREVLFREITSSIHLANGIVYGWTHSNPSGNPLTVIVNSIFNSIMCRVVFVHSTQLPLQEYDKHVRAVNYGDDNVLSISSHMVEKFNQLTMTSSFAAFGLTYTDEAKSGILLPSRSLKQVAFLKRSFVKRNGGWVAPLSLNTITEMVQWQRKSVDKKGDCAVVVEKALSELSLHDDETFDKVSKEIFDACRKAGVKPKRYCQLDLSRALLQPTCDLPQVAQSEDCCVGQETERPPLEDLPVLQMGSPQANNSFKNRRSLAKECETLHSKGKLSLGRLRKLINAKNSRSKREMVKEVSSHRRDSSRQRDCERRLARDQKMMASITSLVDEGVIPVGFLSLVQPELNRSGEVITKQVRRVVEMKTQQSAFGAVMKFLRNNPLVRLWSAFGRSQLAVGLNVVVTHLLLVMYFVYKGVEISKASLYAARYREHFIGLVSPITEEIAHLGFPKAKIFFAFYELYAKFVNGQLNRRNFPIGLPAFFLHILTAFLPFEQRVFLHGAFNTVIYKLFNNFALDFEIRQVAGGRPQLWEKGRRIGVNGDTQTLIDWETHKTLSPYSLWDKDDSMGETIYLPRYVGAPTDDFLTQDTTADLSVDYETMLNNEIMKEYREVRKRERDYEKTYLETYLGSFDMNAVLGCCTNFKALLGTVEKTEQQDHTLPTHVGELTDTNQGAEMMQHGEGEQQEKIEHVEPIVHISNIHNDIKMSLEREITIGSATWRSDHTPGTLMLKGSLPGALFTKNPFFVNRTSYFAYLKADIEIKLMLNATKFTCGQLYLFFSAAEGTPGMLKSFAHTHTRVLTCLPGVNIKAQTGATGTLRVPYCYPTKAFGLHAGGGHNIGQYDVCPLNALRGADKASFTVTGRLINPELSVPSLYATSAYGAVAGLVGPESGDATVSTLSNVGSSLASAFSRFSTKAHDDKSSLPVAQMPAKTWTNWSSTDGSAKLAQTSHAHAGYSDSLGLSSEDEMSTKYLCCQKVLMHSFAWRTDQNAGEIIFKLDVSPRDLLKVGDVYYTDFIGYLANAFSLWRGGMLYEFDALSTLAQSGRLRIALAPPSDGLDDPTSADELNNLPNFVLDLQADDPVVRIPASYLGNEQWRAVAEGQNCARIFVGVINPLISSTPDIAQIDVAVWRQGLETLEFSAPRDPEFYPQPTTEAESEIPVLQMRSTPCEDNGKPFEDEHKDHAVCEAVSSIRDVVKRACPVSVEVLTTNKTLTIDPMSFGEFKTRPALITYFSYLYKYFRGSRRFKITCDKRVGELSAAVSYGAFPYQGFYASRDRPHVAQYRTNLAINPYLEVEVPWYYNYPIAFVQKEATPTELFDKACRPALHLSYTNSEEEAEPTTWLQPDPQVVTVNEGFPYVNTVWERWTPTEVTEADIASGGQLLVDGIPIITAKVSQYDFAPIVLRPGYHWISINGGKTCVFDANKQLSDQLLNTQAAVTIWESAGDDFSFSWLACPQPLVSKN